MPPDVLRKERLQVSAEVNGRQSRGNGRQPTWPVSTRPNPCSGSWRNGVHGTKGTAGSFHSTPSPHQAEWKNWGRTLYFETFDECQNRGFAQRLHFNARLFPDLRKGRP